MFAVVGGVRQDAVKVDMLSSLPDRLGKLRRVVAGAPAYHSAREQMGVGLANDCQLGPSPTQERLVTGSVNVVGTGMARLQSRGVHGSFGKLVKEA